MRVNCLNRDIHARDYLYILRRRKWIIITFFLITVTAVTLATFLQEEVYRATSTVIVDVEGPPDVLAVKDVVKTGETNYMAYRDYIETQKEIIRSRRTAHYVMKHLKLDRLDEFKKENDPIEHLLKKLRAELISKTRILKISVDNGDPKLASLIANEFAKVYADLNIALKMKALDQAQAWLREEVEQQKNKVNESELNLQTYKEANDIVFINNQKNMINDSMVKLNTNYLEAKTKRIRTETSYRSLIDNEGNMTLKNLPVLTTGNETIQQLKNDYLKQEALLVEYRKVYKGRHPKMITLLGNIAHLESRIKSEIKTEYKNSVEQENKFLQVLEEQNKKALELERKIIKYNALQREVETSERVLQIVLNRLKKTSILNQIQANNIRVQDLAEVPIKPIKPRKKLNIALAIIVGLSGGVALAFFRDYMDTTIKDPNEIASLLEIPILGSVPKVRPDGKNIKKKEEIDRIVEKDTYSLASEAYRTIRANLLFSLNHSSSSKSIVITSSVPREGKTMTAINLSVMIANSGERVLLVDADMRKPRIHTVFNLKNEPGLSQFLLEENDLDSIIKDSGIDNMRIVTAGKCTHKPKELLCSKNMKQFLEEASSKFSKIILDTPPVSLLTDAQILSSVTTGVILIAESGRSTRDLLVRSRELLQKVDARIIGVILNNIALTKDVYSCPQYYYGKYYNPNHTR
ncbi:MAG: polysaccharide biosynthesis tyrosine autokinase [Candidatus Omnitrophica bacterium]|nr:polysaccharide biosynthesis tyrosine autokinase [Candidatus Omnitrophota bacterium]